MPYTFARPQNNFATGHVRNRPFRVGSTLYAVVQATTPSYALWKSTDEGDTWSSVSGESFPVAMDDWSPLNTGSGIEYLNSTTFVYTAALDPQDYTTETVSGVSSSSPYPIALRSNGERVAFFKRSTTNAVMGTNYNQVSYRRRTATNTWAAEVVVSTVGAASHTPIHAIPYGDRVHFFYAVDGTNQPILTKTLSAANALSSEQTASATALIPTVSDSPRSVSDPVFNGSTCTFVVSRTGTGSYAIQFDAASDSPTFTTTALSSGGGGGEAKWPVLVANPVTAGDLILVYVDNTFGTLRYVERVSGTWQTSGTTLETPANPYQFLRGLYFAKANGSKTIGVWTSTNATSFPYQVDYGEIQITVSAPTLTLSGAGTLSFSGGAVPKTPTAAPTVAAGTGKVTVTTPALSTSEHATSFNIYRGGTLVATGIGGSTAYDDTGASVTATQTYTVRGVAGGDRISPDSPTSSAAVANPVPPSFFVASTSSGAVVITILEHGYSNVVYRVYRGLSGGSRSLVHTSAAQDGTGQYSWGNASLTNGTAYDFTVTAEVSTPTTRESAQSAVQTETPTATGWTTATQYPFDLATGTATNRHVGIHKTAVLDTDKIVVGNSETTRIYRPSTNTWELGGPGVDTYQWNIAVADGEAYELGEVASPTLKKLTTPGASGAWTTVSTTLPGTLPRHFFSLDAAGGDWLCAEFWDGSVYKLYKWRPSVGGSWTLVTTPPLTGQVWAWWFDGVDKYAVHYDSGALGDMRVYSLSGNSWTTATENPRGLYGANASTHSWELFSTAGANGKFYVTGGLWSGDAYTAATDAHDLWEYDTATDTWTLLTSDLPQSTEYPGFCIYAGAAFVFNGRWSTTTLRNTQYVGLPVSLGQVGSVALSGAGTLTGAQNAITLTGVTAALTGAGTLAGSAVSELLPPTGLTVTVVSPTQLDISWNAATGATGYDLERNGVIISSYQAGLTYSDTGLVEGTTYTYRVRSQKVES